MLPHSHGSLFVSSLSASEAVGDAHNVRTSHVDDPNWSKVYSLHYNTMLSNRSLDKGGRGDIHSDGIDLPQEMLCVTHPCFPVNGCTSACQSEAVNDLRIFTESHSHRMLGIGRDPERSSSPIRLQEQEHLHRVPQEPINASFECLRRRRLHNSVGKPVPVFCHPHCEKVSFHI